LGYKTSVIAAYRVDNLEFSYGRTPVLRGISAEIARGEFVALVGPNGAGKSTFLKVLAGLLRRYKGTVEFMAHRLAGLDAARLARRVAFVPQETHVAFPFTAGEIVLMGRLPHRDGFFDSKAGMDRAAAAMELTDTAALSSKTFGQLSGGEKQRVILASALAQDPEVLLLDEPTVYLDLKHQIQFYDILERLNRERQITIISVTHDINLAARYARRMIAVRGGRFAADGSPEAVLTPQHLYEIFEISASVFQRPDGRGSYIVPTS
jgi:iron complex transport system ATP-binding protein